MAKKIKKKNYNLRSKVYGLTGNTTVLLTSVGGFVTYGALTEWEGFQNAVDNFMVVQPETVKLNPFIAIGGGVAFIIYFLIMRKKNKEFFKDKTSVSLLIAVAVSYLIYSIIEVTLAVLIGALGGSVFNEFLFTPLSKSAKIKHEQDKEFDNEYKKEIVRIKARESARESLDGSV